MTDYDRLGDAWIQGETNAVPVPQRAFDLELLRLDDEVHWGRDEDGVLLASASYDALQTDGRTYVGTSEVDDERLLRVPDVAADHWDRPIDGEPVVFATTDALESDGALAVLTREEAEARDLPTPTDES